MWVCDAVSLDPSVVALSIAAVSSSCSPIACRSLRVLRCDAVRCSASASASDSRAATHGRERTKATAASSSTLRRVTTEKTAHLTNDSGTSDRPPASTFLRNFLP